MGNYNIAHAATKYDKDGNIMEDFVEVRKNGEPNLVAKKDIHFITSLHLGAVLMGGANSNYSTDFNVDFLDSARTYNIGPGAMLTSESILRVSFGSIYLKYNLWWIHTWDGAPGDEIIGMLAPKIRFRIYENWFLGIEYLYYHRRGKYDELQNISQKNNEERIFIGHAF